MSKILKTIWEIIVEARSAEARAKIKTYIGQ
jgi:hypothetical protein